VGKMSGKRERERERNIVEIKVINTRHAINLLIGGRKFK
jgi:hypothetical protein